MTLTWGQILGALGIGLEGIGLYVLIKLTSFSFEEFYQDHLEERGETTKGKFERKKCEILKTQVPILLGLLFQLLAVFIP